MSENVLNEYMCTETCPCFNYNSMGVGSKAKYEKVHELTLDKYNRTFNSKDKSKRFMNFTSDKDVGFSTFDECYEHHQERAKKDPSIKIEEVFKVNIGDLRSRLPEKKGIKGRGHRIRDDAAFILKHFDEMELYEGLEDEYNCSGMCKPSLFYFSRPLHEGRP